MVKRALAGLVVASGMLAMTGVTAVPASAQSECVVTVSNNAGQYMPAVDSAAAWWNYTLEGTGIRFQVVPAGSPAFVAVNEVSRDFMNTLPWADALGAAVFAPDGVHSNVYLPSDMAVMSEPTVVAAHELGHTLFAGHAYAGTPIQDPYSVMGAGHGLAASQAFVNETDRAQVLAQAPNFSRIYCPGFIPRQPEHEIVPKRGDWQTREAVTAWFSYPGSDLSNLPALTNGAKRVMIARRINPEVVGAFQGFPAVAASKRTLKAMVNLECTRSNPEVGCLPKNSQVAGVIVSDIPMYVESEEWKSLRLPN